MIVWEVLLFIYLRKYEWVGDVSRLDHPVAIIGLSYMLFRVIHLIVEAPGMYLPFGPRTISPTSLLSGRRQPDTLRGIRPGQSTVGRPAPDKALAAAHRMVNGLIKAFVIAPIFLRSSISLR